MAQPTRLTPVAAVATAALRPLQPGDMSLVCSVHFYAVVDTPGLDFEQVLIQNDCYSYAKHPYCIRLF
jgi:hypothetical protein